MAKNQNFQYPGDADKKESHKKPKLPISQKLLLKLTAEKPKMSNNPTQILFDNEDQTDSEELSSNIDDESSVY